MRRAMTGAECACHWHALLGAVAVMALTAGVVYFLARGERRVREDDP